MSSLGRRARGDRGAAAVEFALLLPILVMLVFGIVQFSLAYNRQQGLHAAAREGARLASLGTSEALVVERVNESLEGVSFPSPPTVAVSQSCLNNSGDTVVVTVTGSTDLDIPFWGNDLVTLTGKGTFRCE